MFSCIFNDGNIYKCLINGEWVTSSSGKRSSIFSPVDGSLVGEVQAASRDDVNHAIQTAHEAQAAWAQRSVNERADIIHRAADLLAREKETIASVLTKEIAKNKKSSLSEVMRTVDFMHFTAEEGKRVSGESLSSDTFPGAGKKKLSIVTRIPLGVVLAIAPFNYPVNLSASKIAPALIAGNAVVFKPPTQGGISALYLARVFCEAGIPAGVLNAVTGEGRAIGDYLVSHPRIDMINFTGSSQVGKHIAETVGMKPLLMELGGKDAAIVLDDADMSLTAKNIVSGAFSYAGQRCTAVKRILVLEESADALIKELMPLVEKLTVGLPDDDADITPLINKNGADFVQALIDDALTKGAEILIGNKRKENLLWPTLCDHVTTDMRLAWEEPFGPVLPIIRVKSIDEAITIANKSEYGLQSSVFTQDIDRAFHVAAQLEVGTVQINGKTERGPDHFPFIGVKSSGLGTQGIRYSIEAMTRAKNVVVNLH